MKLRPDDLESDLSRKVVKSSRVEREEWTGVDLAKEAKALNGL